MHSEINENWSAQISTPLFRLRIGVSPTSGAFSMAEMAGLESKIVQRALDVYSSMSSKSSITKYYDKDILLQNKNVFR